jgi:hypothetical protein
MQYTLRTLLILLLAGPPTLAGLHAHLQRKAAEQLLTPLTNGWDIAPQGPSILLTVTPRMVIMEEDEELLGLNVSVADAEE